MRETPLLHEIRAVIANDGRVMIWRSNTGVDLTRGVRYGLGKGGADLVGLVRGSGRFCAFEVKTPTGRQSPNQRLWANAVRAAGGYYAIVRSLEDARHALEEACA